MLETLVTLWHKGLKSEHTMYTDAMAEIMPKFPTCLNQNQGTL